MRVRHDNPNIVFRLMGSQIYNLANIGATDKELRRLFRKGPDATLMDVARIEAAHTHYDHSDERGDDA